MKPESYALYEGNEEITLSKTEYELLLYLIKHKSRVISKDELLDEVWGYDFEGNQNVVEVYINYLRKKIKSGKTLIKTVRGVGYTIKE
jgi:DNA-binding response OmpR family regulator